LRAGIHQVSQNAEAYGIFGEIGRPAAAIRWWDLMIRNCDTRSGAKKKLRFEAEVPFARNDN
jgi:hypothetical protein